MNSREIAFLTIEEVFYRQSYSNIALNNNIRKYGAEEDEGFIREIVYGVIENKLYLEYIIKKVSSLKLKKIHEKIYVILVMGVYQIYFMDRVPESAAVNEAVKLAKKYGNRGSVGFVNGLLRTIVRRKEELADVKIQDRKHNLSVRYSHPLWLVERWVDEFGYEFTEKLCKANNDVAKFTIRVNPIRTTKDKLIGDLLGQGYQVLESEISKDSLIVKNPGSIFKTGEFLAGDFTVQGESSSLVGDVLDPREGSLVLDTCAAPGGKSLHMAEKMGNKGQVIARDIHLHRLSMIEENVKRLGLSIVRVQEHDARILDESLRGRVDYCLVDAPCSGLGTIRKNPEIKYNRSYEDLVELSRLQAEILNTSKDYVKKGGILVYSTCTIGRMENDDIVEAFLRENEDFELLGDFIKLYPNINDTDGFFISKMIRK